jgi:iron complex outermembrane receptor protein
MNVGIRTRLLTATALVAASIFASQAASAQSVSAPEDLARNTKVSNPEEIKVSNPEEIVVTAIKRVAGGLMKEQRAPESISSISAEAIAQRTPLATPLQLISTVPGANFGTSDAFGLTIRNFVAIRGLDQTEIGWVVEGQPAVDPQNLFPFIERWIDNENISDITVIPGNSRLEAPVLNATGGEFNMAVRDPSADLGGRVSASAGTSSSRRLFGRIDTGEIGKTGITAFISGSYAKANVEYGPGENTRWHIDFKARGDWGSGSSSTLWVSTNQLDNARVPIPNLAQFNAAKASGNFDTLGYLPTYPAGGSTNYFKQYIIHRTDWAVSNINKIQVSDRLRATITPYFHYMQFVSPGAVNLAQNSIYNGNQQINVTVDPAYINNGRIFAQNNQQLTEYQYGVTGVLEYDITDTNHFMVGYWHDSFDLRTVSFLNPLDVNGVANGSNRNVALQSAGRQLATGIDYKDRTLINQFFVGDTQSFFDNRLQLSAGVKYLDFQVDIENYVSGPPTAFSTRIKKWLPRASFSFDATDKIQLYGNVVKSVRTPLTTGTYVQSYSVGTGAIATAANFGAKTESSLGGQLGFRYNGAFHVEASAFYNALKDVQVTSLTPINGANVTTVLSAGRATLKGFVAEVSTPKFAGFSIYANTQYLDATLKDNLAKGGDLLPTAGKVKPLSPKWTNSAVLRYDSDMFFGNVTYKHLSSQYSTFMNDERMGAYGQFDLTIGARLESLGMLKAPTATLNFLNVGGHRYLGAIAGLQANAKPTVGINGTTIAGAAPIYYVAAGPAVTFTLSTAF